MVKWHPYNIYLRVEMYKWGDKVSVITADFIMFSYYGSRSHLLDNSTHLGNVSIQTPLKSSRSQDRGEGEQHPGGSGHDFILRVMLVDSQLCHIHQLE